MHVCVCVYVCVYVYIISTHMCMYLHGVRKNLFGHCFKLLF